MHSKKILLFVLISLTLLSTGCSTEKVENKKAYVNSYNKQVEFITSQYEISSKEAKTKENLIIETLFKDKVISDVSEEISEGYSAVLNSSIIQVKENLNLVLFQRVEEEKQYSEMFSELETEEINIEELTEKVSNQIKDGVEVYYLIDSEKGIVEQLFVIPNINGNHGLLSFYWLDGICFDSNFNVTGV